MLFRVAGHYGFHCNRVGTHNYHKNLALFSEASNEYSNETFSLSDESFEGSEMPAVPEKDERGKLAFRLKNNFCHVAGCIRLNISGSRKHLSRSFFREQRSSFFVCFLFRRPHYA